MNTVAEGRDRLQKLIVVTLGMEMRVSFAKFLSCVGTGPDCGSKKVRLGWNEMKNEKSTNTVDTEGSGLD